MIVKPHLGGQSSFFAFAGLEHGFPQGFLLNTDLHNGFGFNTDFHNGFGFNTDLHNGFGFNTDLHKLFC